MVVLSSLKKIVSLMTLLPSFIIDLIKSIVYVHIHVYATVHIYHSFTEKATIVFFKMGFAQYLSRMLVHCIQV